MAETIPLNFPIPGESAIASYDYADIVDGTGIAEYFLFTSVNDAGTAYGLTPNSIYSSDIAIHITANGTYTFTSGAFATPRTAKGIATVNLFTWVEINDAVKFNVKLQKVDTSGGTTDLAVAQEKTTAAPFSVTQAKCFQFDVPTTRFKKGEKLRIIIVITGWVDDVAAFGCDPKNRVDTYLGMNVSPTSSVIYMPWRIDNV